MENLKATNKIFQFYFDIRKNIPSFAPTFVNDEQDSTNQSTKLKTKDILHRGKTNLFL